MRLVTRVPARGRVKAISVRFIYDGTASSPPVEVTDVQLQPGEASGVVPHPTDVNVRAADRQYRNGVITRPEPEVIVLANSDRAAPTRITAEPAGEADVKIGGYRFPALNGTGWADAATGAASRGFGAPPVITERSDGYIAVDTTRPVHVGVAWNNRY